MVTMRSKHLVCQTKIAQEETVINDMMQQLDDKAGNEESFTADEDKNAPRVPVIVDKQRAGIVPKLGITKGMKYHICDYLKVDSLEELLNILSDNVHRNKIHTYDLVVIVCGLQDILGNDDGFRVFGKTVKVIKQLISLEVDVAVTYLPPAPGNKLTDSRIYNMKIEQLPKKNQ